MAKGIGAAMAGGNPRLGREAEDYYPTPPEVTWALVGATSWDGPIWEPACGDGAMVRVLRAAGHEVVATDLVDRGMRGGVDFLQAEELLAPHIVTNPPFALAADFIRHAHRLGAQSLALVLKATYWHPARSLPLFDEFPPAAVHPLTWRPDFLSRGAPTMDVVWTVWRRGHSGPTVYRPLRKPVTQVGLFEGVANA